MTAGEDRTVFFPVRHHSPACAAALRSCAQQLKPAAVLIEGPSDFNDRLPELRLDHQLPIAVYSYVRSEGRRMGAYHPFCEYSPEWQALQVAWKLGAAARFIDLPWAAMCNIPRTGPTEAGKPKGPLPHRYGDPQLRRSRYIDRICAALGVDDFDAAWDELFEFEPNLSADEYRRRCRSFCDNCRSLDTVDELDLRREEFMADRVAEALEEFAGSILVVTGGYHSAAIRDRLFAGAAPKRFAAPPAEPVAGPDDQGIALTPYSDERLDRLTGYEAGMPGPGFYQVLWKDRLAGRAFRHEAVLRLVAEALRKRGQTLSTADLIGVETAARALSALRGHAEVARRDLVDALRGSVLKDETARGGTHPLLAAIDEVFRGSARGRLAEGTSVPPLVRDLNRLLEAEGLVPHKTARTVELELDKPDQRRRSRILHRLLLLKVAGFDRTGGSDFVGRQDLMRVWERWEVRWSPDFDATAIEAARYGASLAEAAVAVIAERMARPECGLVDAAELLIDAALAGLGEPVDEIRLRLLQLVHRCGDFGAAAETLGHLLHLYAYDTVLEFAGRDDLASLLRETCRRGLWLLESRGTTAGADVDGVRGIARLVEAFERCGADLGISLDEFAVVLKRVQADRAKGPAVRAAAVGALLTLGRVDTDAVLRDLRLFGDAEHLGDFLGGLFAAAREKVQRRPELPGAIDELLMGFDDGEFLEALPALRLAFTYFTPREKHHIAQSVLEAAGGGKVDEPAPAALEVPVEVAAQSMALEARLFEAARRFGIRFGAPVSEGTP